MGLVVMPGLCVNCHLILITTAFIAVHFGKSKSDSHLAPVTCDNLPPDHKPSLIHNPNIKYREKIYKQTSDLFRFVWLSTNSYLSSDWLVTTHPASDWSVSPCDNAA